MQVRAASRPPAASESAGDALLQLLALALGLSVSLGRYVPSIGPITLTFLLGVSFGVLGWWRGVVHPVLRQYVRWIVPFAVVGFLSLVAANDVGSIGAQTSVVWLLLVPGIATLVADGRLLTQMLRGLVIGASWYLVVAVARLANGQPVLEPDTIQLLGINRNAVDMQVVWLVPVVLVAPSLRIPRLARALYVVGAVLYVFNSEGRTGLIALLMVPLLLVGFKPAASSGRQAARIAAVFGVVALGAAVVTTSSLDWVPAVGRIQQYQTQERHVGDEVRLILNRKAFALVEEHPFLGVGLGKFDGAYDPVIEEASSRYIRQRALTAPGHNTFLEVLATTGIIGFVLFVGALASPLVQAVRRAFDRDALALAVGFSVILFSISLHTTLGTLPAFPIALTLAVAMRASPADEPA